MEREILQGIQYRIPSYTLYEETLSILKVLITDKPISRILKSKIVDCIIFTCKICLLDSELSSNKLKLLTLAVIANALHKLKSIVVSDEEEI
jgi:methylthioribose-1-phosphate isomerase